MSFWNKFVLLALCRASVPSDVAQINKFCAFCLQRVRALARFVHFGSQVSYRDACKMNSYFKSYVVNFNRIRMAELIDRLNDDRNVQAFRASLVVNPHTGRCYDSAQDEASVDILSAR